MFSRFLGPYLAPAAHAGCTIGILAAIFAVSNGHNDSGRHGHAYGSVGHPRSRALRPDSPGCPAEATPEVAASAERPGVARAADPDGGDPRRSDRPRADRRLAHWGQHA